MHEQTLSPQMLRAVGSVMNVYPTGDYSEHMPKGTTAQRISRHWVASGRFLAKATREYAGLVEKR